MVVNIWALAMAGVVVVAVVAFVMWAIALLLEMAGGWQETTRPSRRRLLQTFSFVLGVIILAVLMYREGWEAGLFVPIFLAIWQLATIETAGDF
jgi:preprotein translocase subunit SecE